MFVLRNVYGQVVGDYSDEGFAIRTACHRSERTHLPIDICVYIGDTLTKFATVSYDVENCVNCVHFEEKEVI